MEKVYFTINAPTSGTFYRRPSPDEDIYVEVGDKVEKSKVVCIVETMKVFNEVRSEGEGIVAEILVEDEDAVITNQAMIKIEKL